MGTLEIVLVVLMVLVVAGACARLAEVRRAREKVAASEITLASLKAKIAAQTEQAEQWRAKADEANTLLTEAQRTADLLATLSPDSPATPAAGTPIKPTRPGVSGESSAAIAANAKEAAKPN